jgi:hypothetical protein
MAELKEVFGRVCKEGVLIQTMSGSHYADDNSLSQAYVSTSIVVVATGAFQNSSLLVNWIFLTTHIHIYCSHTAKHKAPGIIYDG